MAAEPATAEPVGARKRMLRMGVRQVRSESEEAVAAAQQRLLDLPELRPAQTVALYAALSGEVSTTTIILRLRAMGQRLVFPRIAGEGLRLFEASGLDELEPGARGVLEPPLSSPEVPAEEVDVFVVPGLLFDRRGHRLGRGGGHYDRLLAGAREDARRVGLCFAERVVGELPVAPWDVRMHVVVSEAGTLRPDGGDAREGSR